MRYAVVSDLHSNLQAWQAALLDIRSYAVDGIICLGDIVGYGPNPAEVMESVNSSVDHFVLGNHDAALAGLLSEAQFSDEARAGLAWARQRLDRRAAAWFREVPLLLQGPGFRCAHGDFGEPSRFHYIIEAEEAMPSWQAADEPILFVGHTHKPGLFVIGRSGTPHRLDPQDFEAEPDKRFIVNPGSVGQSRDGDVRASYCIFDAEARTVHWRRVPFDLDAYAGALDRAGLRPSADWFLQADPRAARPPLRAMLGFAPSLAPEGKATGVVGLKEIDALKHSVRTWRRTAAAAACALLVGTAATAGTVAYHKRAPLRFDAAGHPVAAAALAPEAELLSPPSAAAGGQPPFTGWTLSLGNRYTQSASLAIDPAGPVMTWTSRSPKAGMELTSPLIAVQPGMSMSAECFVRKSEDFNGSLALVISAQRRTPAGAERIEHLVLKEPNEPRKEGWMLARHTFRLPAGAESIEYRMRGRFEGSVEIKGMSLKRK